MSVSLRCLVGVALVLVSVQPSSSFNQIFFNSCPSPAVVTPFDSTAFTAASPWFEVRRYKSWLEPGATRCVTWNFAETSTSVMTVTTTMTSGFGTDKTMVATVTQDNTVTDAADFSYVITDLPGPAGQLPGTYDYKILAFDATSGYAVAWSCKNGWLGSEQLMWVLTTSQTPAASVTDAALAAITALGLNTSKLRTVTQTNC